MPFFGSARIPFEAPLRGKKRGHPSGILFDSWVAGKPGI